MEFRGVHRTRVRGRGLATLTGVVVALSMALAASASASFTQQTTLTATDEIGHSGLGSGVALSSDGKTALIGGPTDDEGVGAAWVFVRNGSTWTEQAKLNGRREIGSGEFGTSVALSSDGNTALMGGPGDNGGLGAAWVFTRSGSRWKQRGKKLTGKDAGGGQEEAHCDVAEHGPAYCFVGHPGAFGASVALSSNGQTALVGSPGDNENDGAAWVFTRADGSWVQQGEKLTGVIEQNFLDLYSGEEHVGGRFGTSVALSSDGNTALIGGPRNSPLSLAAHERLEMTAGNAWLLTRSGATWTQQPLRTGLQVDGDELGELGQSVALSADGGTALVGMPANQGFTPEGAAWVFTASGPVRVLRAERFDGQHMGERVGISSDGYTALLGGAARLAWVFTRSEPAWTQQPGTLACSGEGCDVALSGDANTALVGTAVYVDP